MTKRFCDKCGIECPPVDNSHPRLILTTNTHEGTDANRSHDLCTLCWHDLRDWLKGTS